MLSTRVKASGDFYPSKNLSYLLCIGLLHSHPAVHYLRRADHLYLVREGSKPTSFPVIGGDVMAARGTDSKRHGLAVIEVHSITNEKAVFLVALEFA